MAFAPVPFDCRMFTLIALFSVPLTCISIINGAHSKDHGDQIKSYEPNH